MVAPGYRNLLFALLGSSLAVGHALNGESEGATTVLDSQIAAQKSVHQSQNLQGSPPATGEEAIRELNLISIFVPPDEVIPTSTPTHAPSEAPSETPTTIPTLSPTSTPTSTPTLAPTGTPTLSPSFSPTQNPFRYCSGASDGSKNASSILVQWIFRVETNSTANPDNLEDLVGDILRDAVIKNLLNNHCGARRRLGDSQRKLQAVSSDPSFEVVGSCEASQVESQSCTTVSGELEVMFDDTGDIATKHAVISTVLTSVKEEVNGEGVLDSVNDELKLNSTNVEVTDIGYEGPDILVDEGTGVSAAKGDEFATDGGGLSTGGKIAISIMAIVVLVILVLCCFWCRGYARRKNGNACESKSVQSNTTGSIRSTSLDDDKCDNECESKCQAKNFDFNNLGQHHSKLDVRLCTSATCGSCNPTADSNNAQTVKFVSIKASPRKWAIIAPIMEDVKLAEEKALTKGTDSTHEDERMYLSQKVRWGGSRGLSP